MLSFRKPLTDAIRRHLTEQARLEFTYAAVGISRESFAEHKSLPGYVVDHTRVGLGTGESTFLAAKQALTHWQQFRLGWLEATPYDTPLAEGAVIAVVARSLGLWWLNCTRIVYTIDESGPLRRFGFAYGTLPDHVESGEERFLIEWDTRNGNVLYDILAFSRPRHVLAKLGYSFVRRAQKRFGRDSAAALQASVFQHAGRRQPRLFST